MAVHRVRMHYMKVDPVEMGVVQGRRYSADVAAVRSAACLTCSVRTASRREKEGVLLTKHLVLAKELEILRRW